MKLHPTQILIGSALTCALAATGSAQPRRGPAQLPPGGSVPAGVSKTVAGTVSQFNYDGDAEVEGFLLSDHTLVHLPPRVAARIGNAIHPGDNLEITGLALRSAAGVQTIEALRVLDRSIGASFSVPQPDRAAPYSGSGRIQQLNYGADGAINGFVLNNGTLARVAPFGASNPSSVKVGENITYSGFARSTVSGRTVVDVQTITMNGQTLNLSSIGPRPPAGPAQSAVPPPPASPAAGPAQPAIPPPPPTSAGAAQPAAPPTPPAQEAPHS